ncbi:MAG: hypothetical protein ACRD16_13605 [Thermoanaerobaculia bacterium]
MKNLVRMALILAAFPAVLSAQTPEAAPAVSADPVRPVTMALPERNPFTCDADAGAALVTRDLPSGVEMTIPEFVSFRIDHTGKIEDTLLVHDPIPSLDPQQMESFKKWEFLPPKKASLAVSGWSTVRLDLKFEYARPQITRAEFVPVTASTPVPAAHPSRWDETWIETAPPLTDLRGAEAVESLDTPPLPRKTKWYADRFRGPFQVKLWVEVSPAGKAARIVPVEVKDPALFGYLKAAIARWNFTPARKASQPVACWGVLDLAGTISYDVSLLRSASIKKSAGLSPP